LGKQGNLTKTGFCGAALGTTMITIAAFPIAIGTILTIKTIILVFD
jgi:hypothetical protein